VAPSSSCTPEGTSLSYYPAWLDFAKWILAVSGIVCLLTTKSQPAGALRGRLKLVGLVLVAGGMMFGGAAGVLFNSRAAEADTEGTVTEVHMSGGRGASTHFDVMEPGGRLLNFSLGSELREIAYGEQARVHYQEGSHAVLYLLIVSGPYAGYSHSESNGLTTSYAVLVGALLVLAYAIWNFISDGTAARPDSDENLKPGPPGDVDELSVLKL